jgi:hypothetical protein
MKAPQPPVLGSARCYCGYSVVEWPTVEGAGTTGSREYVTPVQVAAVVGPALYGGPLDGLPSVIARTSASQA